MARAETSIGIARSPEEVFAIVGDPANNPRWRKNVIRTEWLGDDDSMRVGRRGRQSARLLGREWTVEAEVVEWEPPWVATWRTVEGPVSVTSWVRVEPDGDGSRVTAGADGSFTGPLGPLLTRLAVPRMVLQAEADLRLLRDQLELPDQPSLEEVAGTDAPGERGAGKTLLVIGIGLAALLVVGVALILAMQLRRGAALAEEYGS